jgi:rhodanese-related sulfurtransferase
MPILSLSCSELKQKLEDDKDWACRLQIVDVRTAEEYAQLGHIPGSELIPLTDLPYAYRMLDLSQPIAVLCQHGVRSLHATHFLDSMGASELYNVTEGFVGWTGSVAMGLPEVSHG